MAPRTQSPIWIRLGQGLPSVFHSPTSLRLSYYESSTYACKDTLTPLLPALDTPRVREVFGQLLESIHQAEADMAVFDLPDLLRRLRVVLMHLLATDACR
jgi:hypothetical protein